MPGLPFNQLPASEQDTTPYSIVENQLQERYGYYEAQEKELKGQMLTDTQYNKSVAGLQEQWGADKENITRNKRQLDQLQDFVKKGIITPEAGAEAQWRLVLPPEAQAAMFPKESGGKVFSLSELGAQQEFIETVAAGAPEQPGMEWGPPKRTQEGLMQQYQFAILQAGYDDPSRAQTIPRRQFDMNWDTVMRNHPEYEWDPESPSVKALRGQGKLQQAAAKQITPLATSVRKDMLKQTNHGRWYPAGKEPERKVVAKKELDVATGQLLLDEAGGDKKKARKLAIERGYKL